LTVDDSRTIRTLIRRQALQMGLEVEEAEDGEQGLAKLAQASAQAPFDLVILDVTMPVLDGPGMLAKARQRGDKTPVLMLTSESRSAVVVGLMKLGICDYILKPFTPEHIEEKVRKLLKLDRQPNGAAHDGAAGAPAAPSAPATSNGTNGAKGESAKGDATSADLLLVDDMENVEKRLRALLPSEVTMDGARTAEAATALCRKRSYRVVLIDSDMPNVDSVSLMKQLRVLQPDATFLSLILRSLPKAQDKSRQYGFAGTVLKPFDTEGIQDLVEQHFEAQELIRQDENVVSVTPFRGRDARQDTFFARLDKLLAASVDGVASACFEEIILDMTGVPARPDKTTRMILEIEQRAKRVGIALRLVGSADLKKSLADLAETAAIRVFPSVNDAKAHQGA
jgi:DNA-binding NtrC family response regulator